MKSNKFEDDNRVIVNMNVEGMRDYNPLKNRNNSNQNYLSRKEMIKFIFSSLSAALLLALSFSAIIILFILFVLKVWLKV